MQPPRPLRTALIAAALFTGCSAAGPDNGSAENAVTTSSASAPLPTLPTELEPVRAALDRFRDPIVAVGEGYLSSVGCIDFPFGVSEGEHMNYKPGAMGVHFINTANIGPTLDPAKPQILLYEWVGDKLQLTGAEWFMPVAISKTAPSVLGKTLDGPMEGHPPILPAGLHHWDLHVWLWKENPNGLFHATNSAIKCAKGPYSYAEHPPRIVHPH